MSKVRNTQDYSIDIKDLLKNSDALLMDVSKLLKDAENTQFEDRVYTYARGGPGGVIPFREASEKAWIALYQVVDVLIHHQLSKIPKGHYDRKLALREIEEKNTEIAKLNIYDRYAARAAHIRNNTTYYTSKDLEFLSFEIRKLKDLMEDIKKVVTG